MAYENQKTKQNICTTTLTRVQEGKGRGNADLKTVQRDLKDMRLTRGNDDPMTEKRGNPMSLLYVK